MISVVTYNAVRSTSMFASPEAPSRVLQRVQTERESALFIESLQRSLQELWASKPKPTTIAYTDARGSPLGKAVVNDAEEKEETRKDAIRAAGAATDREILGAYSLLERSIGETALKRHTVMPGTGVHGVIHVPMTMVIEFRRGPGMYQRRIRADECTHVVSIRMQGISDSVRFSPGIGE